MNPSRPKILIYSIAVVLAILTVTACDDKGDNAAMPTGQYPVIRGVGSDASELLAGGYTSVYCDAYDPDGDSLRYSWSADYGTFPESNRKAAVRWVAPSAPCTATITCTVSDGRLSASMKLGIIVKPKQ